MKLPRLENCERKLNREQEHQKRGKYFAKFFFFYFFFAKTSSLFWPVGVNEQENLFLDAIFINRRISLFLESLNKCWTNISKQLISLPGDDNFGRALILRGKSAQASPALAGLWFAVLWKEGMKVEA